MNPFSFVFIGNSGCGKGTQGALLTKALQEKHPEYPVHYMETGNGFRTFIDGKGYSNELSRKIYDAGERQPDFLAIWNWTHIMIDSLKPDEHVIVDGAPRAYSEAIAFMSAMKFYSRKPMIVYLSVSREWSKRHLLERARADDNIARVEKRLDWFDKDVMPAIEYFKSNPDCVFVEVNGEQTVPEVFAEMMKKLNI